MSAAPKDSDGPTAGTRTARLAEVWEAANALAAAQMPKQLSGSTRPSDISFESTNSVDHSSPIPLRHRRLVDAAIAPTSPSRWRLVAGLCLIAVILTGGTSAVIAFRQFPLADIWHDHVSSWTESETAGFNNGKATGLSAAENRDITRDVRRTRTARLGNRGVGRGRGRDYHRRAGWNGYFNR